MNVTARPFFLATLVAVLVGGNAHAERADRDQPVHIEAARVTVDDVKRTHLFEGNVLLSQGTLTIRAAKLVVTQDAEGFQKGVASGGEGGLARLRQRREASDGYMHGEAERIEYDARTETAEFFNRAIVKSGADEVRGHYISYDSRTGKYLVTARPGVGPDRHEGRVTAIIQPKGARTAPAAPAR